MTVLAINTISKVMGASPLKTAERSTSAKYVSGFSRATYRSGAGNASSG